MSEILRVVLVGSTGLVGRCVMQQCIGRGDVRLTGISRREIRLPQGARMEMFVADPGKWGEVIEAVRPTALICALGSTWKKSGQDEDAFRAVDQQLVVNTARAARAAGVPRLVAVSSVGADPLSKNFYLKVKGEVETELTQLRFNRCDILRPGLLRGKRIDDPRGKEGLAQLAAPLTDLFMRGKMSVYRSIDANIVAAAALGLAGRRAAGRFTHDYDGILRAAREWDKLGT
ncbi:NAD(P)H-binding protein [Erythrobacteraceae bacterium E2-1 Yellow Sea]|nr:NAD(P)H-binding protein [Erythrobacteraceae bacterium E2-1 Yellow Sea]